MGHHRLVATAATLAMLATACSSGDAGGDQATAEQAAPALRQPEPAGLDAAAPPPPVELPAEGDEVLTRDPGISPFVVTADDSLSTFAMDVDTAAWTQAIAWLERGQLPPASLIRPEEFLNWFEYGYPDPGEAWSVQVDGLATTPWNPETSLLRVGLTTADIDPAERPDATLTFVVDVSGSMSGEPLQTVKQTLLLLVDQLRPSDRIAIVTYGSNAEQVLPPTPLSERQAVTRAIEGLESGGSTYAEAGLALGYQVARQARKPGGISTVVLASDGVANVGATGPEEILDTIGDGVDAGINLLALGVSADTTYNDALMEQLANQGNGSVFYISGPAEAERLFVDRLESTLVVVARESKIQVQFHPEQVARWRLVGYDNRALADDDFRDDEVDAGEVGAGHEVTAVYEVVLNQAGADEPIGTVRLRWEDPNTREVTEIKQEIAGQDLRPDAATGFGTAVQAVALAEVLRGSPHIGTFALADIAGIAPDLPADPVIGRALDLAQTSAPAPGA